MKTVTIIKNPRWKMWQRVVVGLKGPVFKIPPSGLLQKSLMISRYKKVNGIYTRGLTCLY